MFCVDDTELVVKVRESREVLYSGGVVGRGDVAWMGTLGVVTTEVWGKVADCKRRKMGLWSEKVKSGSMRTVQERTIGTWVRVRMT